MEAVEVEKSTLLYFSPMVIVGKKNGGLRVVPVCGDYNCVNSITRFDAEPVFDQQSFFHKLLHLKAFPKLDLAAGFLLNTTTPSSRKLTVVITTGGLFLYSLLRFGLTNNQQRLVVS